ncbi:uncharacterized protein LOC130749275 isoform X1 [Lotus japonicus]|uniref:uncharacterized protein LOC130749275 isoform X1 n=1 Tax=Lotus japonicus TaxID=34305 RepID=UPI0025886834|nr:uncharacterized protein LOC130749275 isoform X1 [Lotus japonicus]
MGITWIEVCLISAHGLQHSTSLWKRQWYAVGWIDHDSKYCTKVDDSGNANPVWKTKFAIPVDDSEQNIQDLALNVEVYGIDPVFFTEKLHGSATIVLKEFLVKQAENFERQGEVGSYQLRKRNSSKPRGFIDILIHISEGKIDPNSHTADLLQYTYNGLHNLRGSWLLISVVNRGLRKVKTPLCQTLRTENSGSKEGIMLLDHGDNTKLSEEGELRQAYPQKQPQASIHELESHVQTNIQDSCSEPFNSTIYYDPYVGEPSYLPPRTKTRTPPPPPPSNVGYIPTFLPINDFLPPSFPDMPLSSRAAPSQRVPPGVALGIGSGALAAGAVIFGDDFLLGYDVPEGIGDDSLDIETDHSF